MPTPPARDETLPVPKRTPQEADALLAAADVTNERQTLEVGREFTPPGALSASHLAIFRAAAEALFDEGPGSVPPARLDFLERELNGYMTQTAGMTRFILRVALVVMQLAPLLTFTAFSRFTSQTVADRQRTLHRLERSPIMTFCLIYLLLKTSLCAVYLEHPEAMRMTGYDGGCLKTPEEATAGGAS